MTRFRRRVAWLAVAAASCATAVAAQPADWGRDRALPEKPGLYWDTCGGCHGSAGRFAPARLTAADGTLRLKGRGVPLATFLSTHPVKLTEAETRILVDTLTTVVTDGAEFQRRCAICHGAVEPFARAHLVVRNGRLAGRYSGRDVPSFLDGHARLDAEKAAFFADVLKRFAAGN